MNGAPPLSCSRTRVIVVVAVVARNLGSLKVGIESSPIIISDSLQKCCSPFIAHDVKIFPFALTMSKTLSKITSTYTYSPRPYKRHINQSYQNIVIILMYLFVADSLHLQFLLARLVILNFEVPSREL